VSLEPGAYRTEILGKIGKGNDQARQKHTEPESSSRNGWRVAKLQQPPIRKRLRMRAGIIAAVRRAPIEISKGSKRMGVTGNQRVDRPNQAQIMNGFWDCGATRQQQRVLGDGIDTLARMAATSILSAPYLYKSRRRVVCRNSNFPCLKMPGDTAR